MNLLNYNHSISSLFILSFRVYQRNFVSILFLTAVLMAPAFLIGIAGWGESESIIFFLSAHILEGAITLGIIGTTFGSFFPSLGILRCFSSTFFLGTIHVAIIQYLLFIIGVMGLTLPFPFSIIIVSLWLVGLLMTSMAQPVFAVEGIRGINALIRSIKLARTNLSRVFLVVVLSTILQFFLFAIIFSIFMPDLNLKIGQSENQEMKFLFSEILRDAGVNGAIRWAQYLVSLLYYPFASIICAFLYFDLVNKQKVLKMEHLEQMSNNYFGTPLGKNTKESNDINDEDSSRPKNIKITDSNTTMEDKEK